VANEPSLGPWTVMVYMAAQLDAETEAAAVRDLREMEQARLKRNVRVFIQINRPWPSFPQIYKLGKGGARHKGEAPGRDTGKRQTLEEFLKFVRQTDLAEDTALPRRYLLVLWGHSFGLGFGRDHGNPLTIKELCGALQTFSEERKAPLDLLGANACALSYAEAAYELRTVVRFMAASEVAVPFAGWPFERILSAIDESSTTEDVGRMIVDRYVSSFQTRDSFRVAISLLDLSRLQVAKDGDQPAIDFKDRIKTLATNLLGVVGRNDAGATDRLAQVRAAFFSTAAGDVRPLIDLKDLCFRLIDFCTDMTRLQLGGGADLKGLHDAARDLAWDLEPTHSLPEAELPRNLHVDLFGAQPTKPKGSGLIVVHKRHIDLRGLNGLGIFAPFVTEPAVLKRLGLAPEDPKDGDEKKDANDERPEDRRQYDALELIKDTNAEDTKEGWASLVYEVLGAGIPADLVNTVESSASPNRASRAAITQMVVGLDAYFDVLDRRIAAAKKAATDGNAAQAAQQGTTAQNGETAQKQQMASVPDPFLDLQLVGHRRVRDAKSKTQNPAAGPGPLGNAEDAKMVVDSLWALEDTIQDLERAVRRTLTDGTFGLGAGPGGSGSLIGGMYSASDLSKPGGLLSARDLSKPGGLLNAPDLSKPGGLLSAPDLSKPGGLLGPAASDPGPAIVTLVSTAATIAALFAQVGGAFARLETAVGEVETLLALATSGAAGAKGGPPNRLLIRRAFRVAAEAAAEARRTVRGVLADPMYGLGPGPDGVGVEGRLGLARAGGMNSTQLRLI
jgi:hypothetical protein